MASSITIKLSGFDELSNRMRKLGAEMQTKGCRQAASAAATVVKKAAIALAPDADAPHQIHGDVIQPGNLKKNIVSKRLARSPLTAEYLVVVRGKRQYGYAARYGRLVEFGTVKMSAQPFLRPAFENNKEKAIQAMAKKLEAFLKKQGA